MKLTWIALPGVLLLGACSSSQHDVPKPPHIGMPNPAAVYCEQQGVRWYRCRLHKACVLIATCLTARSWMNGRYGVAIIPIRKSDKQRADGI